jgi:hypothetical protein
MARKERPGEKLIDKNLTDDRYNNPQDARIQERKLEKSLEKLRKLGK